VSKGKRPLFLQILDYCRKAVVPSLIAFTVIAPTIATILGNISAAIMLLVIGAAALVLTRLDDIRRIKLWSLEAELERKIDEARATLEQLRQLARAVAEPALSTLAMQGSIFKELKFSYRYRVQQRIDHALEELGVPVGDRQQVGTIWYAPVARGLAGLIVNDVRQTRPDLVARIDELGNANGDRPAAPDAYREFLQANGLMNDERAGRLDDYQHFWNTGEVRRPDDWPVGYHP